MILMLKIVFFSEGSEHTRFLEPIINKLLEIQDIQIHYYSLDYDEKPKISKNLKFFYVERKKLISTLKNIEADYFFTTTPGVGSLYFPRAKHVGKYVYTFHSLLSPNEIYKRNSFTNFDIIMSPNALISSQLQFLISKKTRLITTGYPLFTDLKKSKIKQNTVLIAPSWGKNNIFTDQNFENLLRSLSSKKYTITIRPHPMQLDFFDKNILKIYEDLNIYFDFEKDLNNLGEYSILITDWSGIALEYYKLTQRFIIFTDTPKKVRRKITSQEKGINLIEDSIREKLGFILKLDEDLDLFLESVNKSKFSLDNKYLETIYTPLFDDFSINEIFKI